MERLEIESASSDASSKISAAWPAQMRERDASPASPADVSNKSTGKTALSGSSTHATYRGPQQSTSMGKERFLEAFIQPGMQAHIQVTHQAS